MRAVVAVTLGENVEALRHARAWTLEELGARVGIDASNVSRIESGQSFPQPLTLEALAQVFEVEVVDLLLRVGSSKRHQAIAHTRGKSEALLDAAIRALGGEPTDVTPYVQPTAKRAPRKPGPKVGKPQRRR